jgi:hypothetical protein
MPPTFLAVFVVGIFLLGLPMVIIVSTYFRFSKANRHKAAPLLMAYISLPVGALIGTLMSLPIVALLGGLLYIRVNWFPEASEKISGLILIGLIFFVVVSGMLIGAAWLSKRVWSLVERRVQNGISGPQAIIGT